MKGKEVTGFSTTDTLTATADGVLKYAQIGDLTLESGAVLPQVTLGYETWGALNEEGNNAILILHALTGDTHVSRGLVSPDADEQTRTYAEAPGWWDGIVGPGCVIDTEKYFVVAPNLIGGCYGSTGPSSLAPDGSPWGSRFPQATIRDSVTAEAILTQQLGIKSYQYVIGASLGGARSIEWAVSYPELVRGCAVIASSPTSNADVIAWAHTQNLAIRSDPGFVGGDYYGTPGPITGLGIARRIAHTTYRSAAELNFRFGRVAQDGENPFPAGGQPRGRYAVESYLDYQAEKLVNRFDANSYLAINEALISHDVTRGRGSLSESLARTNCHWLVVYVDSDRLFYPSESVVLAAELPGAVEAKVIHSASGHDGFLIETDQVEKLLADALREQEENESFEKQKARAA